MTSFTRPARAPDYSDRFSGPNGFPHLTAREAAMRAFRATPLWFRLIFALRQAAARLAGLKTGPDGRIGEVELLARLPVAHEADDVLEIGMADRHLDFTITVERTRGEVGFATDIWFNGAAGRAYLWLVMPFHRMILRRYVAALGPDAS